MITKKEILIKYDLKEHTFKHLVKKFDIKPISNDGYKNYYNESEFSHYIGKYSPKKKWSDKEIDVLNKCYPIGGYKECEKVLNRKNHDIKAKAYSLNIFLNSEIKSKIYVKSMLDRESSKTQKDFKILYEDLINLEDKIVCYFLGFMWADGHINNNRISMTLLKDDMLVIKSLISKYGEWNFFLYKERYMGFKVYCKPFFDFLVENDFSIKSKIPPIKILSKIPKDNISYFFRGFFDGDGSFSLNYRRKSVLFSVTGPYNYDWSFVIKIFNNLGIKYTIRNIKNPKSGFSEVRINRLKDTTKLSKFIYNEGNWDYIGLERKFNRAFINENRKLVGTESERLV